MYVNSIIAIEEKYDGPKLDDSGITLEFVKDLLEAYKNQKKLHRKYAYKVKKKIIK